jgi:hypothetical protein
MPVWHEKPQKTLHDALGQVWEDLNEATADNPKFDEVAGLSSDQLTRHAMEAVTAFIKNTEPAELSSPVTMVQVYSLGFVVGMKYGEGRQQRAPDPD